MEHISTFEVLPDEMILQVCRYLHCVDILYSFYNLNSRLNATITQFCQHMNLRHATYKQFTYVATHIAPKLSNTVQSFIFDGKWEKTLMDVLKVEFFQLDFVSMFPQLHTLRLGNVTDKQLNDLFNRINDHPQLTKLELKNFNNENSHISIEKILAANSKRLKSILFDRGSARFVLDGTLKDEPISYFNVQNLMINLQTDKSLEYMFKLVPNVESLHINFEQLLAESELKLQYSTYLTYLKDFQLNSAVARWSLNEITSILTRMPSLDRFALNIHTGDWNMVNGQTFIQSLPSSIVHVHLFIVYHYSESHLDVNMVLSTWPTHIKIRCLLKDAKKYAIIYSSPFYFKSITIPAPLGSQMPAGFEYAKHVRELKILRKQTSAEVYQFLEHFRDLRTLVIDSRPVSEASKTGSIQRPIAHLLHLKTLQLKRSCNLFPLVQAAPNLCQLRIDFSFFTELMKDIPTFELLQKRIVDLDFTHFRETDSAQLEIVADKFSHLRDLTLFMNNQTVIVDAVILQVLSFWKDKTLRALYVKGLLGNEMKRDLRQWLINHRHFHPDDLFTTVSMRNWVCLWLQ